MLPSRYFSDLTQPEIAAQFKKNPLVILPCGSVEQHGPHLPTGTDTLAANVISHAVAERMDGLVLPNTPFGVTPMHAPFEGTITLTPDTYMRLIIETCASTAKHGAKELMIVNWHEGNIPSLAIAAESLHREHGMSVLTVQACYVAEELYGHSCGGLTHGGEIEALAVLAHRPDLVHLDRIDYSSDHALGHKMDKLRRTRSLPAGADRHPLDRADRLVRQPAARHRRQGPQDAERHLPTPSPRRRARSSASSTRCRAAPREIKQLRQWLRWADGAAVEAIRGEEARPAGPDLAGAGVGRDRLERDVPHRRDRGAEAGRSGRAARICTTASRNASTCSRAPA